MVDMKKDVVWNNLFVMILCLSANAFSKAHYDSKNTVKEAVTPKAKESILNRSQKPIQVIKTRVGEAQRAIGQGYVCEGKDGRLQCPDGEAIVDIVATFGKDQEDCKIVAGGSCNADVSSKLTEICGSQSICSFTVDSKTFDDPCPESDKALHYVWNCEGTRRNQEKGEGLETNNEENEGMKGSKGKSIDTVKNVIIIIE